MISHIRLASQQLSKPGFDNPKDLVSWMGAIQGENYNMEKWAIGIRLKTTALQPIEQALQKGEILRTHILTKTSTYLE